MTPYSKSFDRLDALKVDPTSGLTWWCTRPLPALQDVVRDGTSPGYLLVKPKSGWTTQPIQYKESDDASKPVTAVILVPADHNLINYQKKEFVNALGFRWGADEEEIEEKRLNEAEKKHLDEIKRK
jgi:hypothetical protein